MAKKITKRQTTQTPVLMTDHPGPELEGPPPDRLSEAQDPGPQDPVSSEPDRPRNVTIPVPPLSMDLDKTKEFAYDDDYFETKVCTADWIDGLSIDILKYCEIGPLTAAQQEKLWNECTDISLIRACDECFMIKTGEFDEIPGQSTEYFSVMTDDEDQLKKEIREQIRQVIGVIQ